MLDRVRWAVKAPLPSQLTLAVRSPVKLPPRVMLPEPTLAFSVWLVRLVKLPALISVLSVVVRVNSRSAEAPWLSVARRVKGQAPAVAGVAPPSASPLNVTPEGRVVTAL